jgi:hypothetical protein
MEVFIYKNSYNIYDINNNIDKKSCVDYYYINKYSAIYKSHIKIHIKTRYYETPIKTNLNNKEQLINDEYIISNISKIIVYYWETSNENESNKIKSIEFIYNNKIHRDIIDGPALLKFDINGNCVFIEYVNNGIVLDSFDKIDISKYNNIYIIENNDGSFKSLSTN